MFVQNGPVHPDAPAGTPKTWGFAGLGLPVRQRYGRRGDQGILRYWALDQDLINPASTHYMGFTINTNGYRANDVFTIGNFHAMEVIIGWGHALYVEIEAGRVRTFRYNVEDQISSHSPWVDIPRDQEHVDVFVQWDCTTAEYSGSRVYLRAGGNSTGGWVDIPEDFVFKQDVGADQVKGRVTIQQAVNLSDIFYSVRNVFNASPNETYNCYQVPKYHAVLDQGINRLTNMPTSKAMDAWRIITDVVSTEYGSAVLDENGIFQFWNYRTIADRQTDLVRRFTLGEVEGLSFTNSIDSVRNVVALQTTRKRAVYTPKLFVASDPFQFYVPGNTTRRFRIWQDDVLSPLTFFMTKFMSVANSYGHPIWNDDVPHGYCIQYEYSNGWQEDPTRTGVDISVYFSSLGYLTVRVTNNWAEAIRLAKGLDQDSQPAFHFAGTKIFSDDDLTLTYTDKGSINKYGAKILPLDGEWYQADFTFLDEEQDGFGIDAIASTILARTRDPVPSTDQITIAGDPRLQLADVFSVTDPDGFGHDMRFQVLGISRTFDKQSGLTDTLTVESTLSSAFTWRVLNVDNPNWRSVETRYPRWENVKGVY